MWSSLAEFEKWTRSLSDQCDGQPCAISETGEEYLEFRGSGMARNGDIDVIEEHVLSYFRWQLELYFGGHRGRIYWRIRPHHEIAPTYVVTKLDENGPDIDFLTNQRCHKDKNWTIIRWRCRVLKSDKPVLSMYTEGSVNLVEAPW